MLRVVNSERYTLFQLSAEYTVGLGPGLRDCIYAIPTGVCSHLMRLFALFGALVAAGAAAAAWQLPSSLCAMRCFLSGRINYWLIDDCICTRNWNFIAIV